MKLTTSEMAFLASQGLSIADVYDATDEKRTVYRDKARQSDCILVLSTACKAKGHRLRSRAGKCVQCNTAMLGFLTRHRKPGFVYIAQSTRGLLFKIGSCENVEAREIHLNRQRYAGCSDWRIIEKQRVEQAGATEFLIHNALSDFRVSSIYDRGDKLQDAREAFCASEAVVRAAFKAHAAGPVPK